MKKLIYSLIFILCAYSGRAQNITQMEYFIDVDSGFGNGVQVTGFSVQPDVANFNFAIPTNLSQGIHTIGVRSKDTNNVWSHTNFFPLLILDSSTAVVTELEYFWDTDPGIGNGMDTIFTSPIADISNGILYAYVPLSLNSGLHTLFVRSKESRNRWSHTNYAQNITVSTSELSELPEISIYPNPVTDKLMLVPNNRVRFILYSPNGQLLFDKSIDSKTEIDMSAYTAGAYAVFLWTDNDKVWRSSIIKQ